MVILSHGLSLLCFCLLCLLVIICDAEKLHGDYHSMSIFYSFLAPVRAPGVEAAHSSGSMSLIVKWSPVAEGDFQGEPIGYEIKFHPLKLELKLNYVSVNYTTNTTVLTNLTVYTTYVINVSAVSSGGIGPANTVEARTGAEGKMVQR